ncbi:helix-turn-helix domain-containing protein [Nocardia sp. NPDC005978]|uniref:PucR family transcriptional regulator n=1 Tax=Nocardia sp. NPDC005978 TaxID=3156725 RepID=UPI0033B98740
MSEPAPTSNVPRLSELTGGADALLRVVDYFDGFDESAANADTVIRAAALLAECPVGASWPGGSVIRYDAAGRLLPAAGTGSGAAGMDPAVWLERAGWDASSERVPRATGRPARSEPVGARSWSAPAHSLDDVVLDRLRHCLRVVATRELANPLRMDDPALLEVVLSEKERREDRVRAMRLLGLDPGRSTRVLALAGPGTAVAVRIIGEQVPVLRQAVIGSITAVLVQDPGRSSVPSGGSVVTGQRGRDSLPANGGTRSGVGVSGSGEAGGEAPVGPGRLSFVDLGLSDTLNAAVVRAFPASQSGADGPWIGVGESLPAYAAATSWEQARRALRFASSTWHGRRVIAFERLGALELLADLPVQRLLGVADVTRVNEFAATEAGALAVDTLEAFCVFGTLRRTATELHLHHSTVAARIAQVEAVMGWDVDDALDRFTATLALFVRRMALSCAQLSVPAAEPTGVGPGR